MSCVDTNKRGFLRASFIRSLVNWSTLGMGEGDEVREIGRRFHKTSKSRQCCVIWKFRGVSFDTKKPGCHTEKSLLLISLRNKTFQQRFRGGGGRGSSILILWRLKMTLNFTRADENKQNIVSCLMFLFRFCNCRMKGEQGDDSKGSRKVC